MEKNMDALQYICNIIKHTDIHIPVSTWPHMSADWIARTGCHIHNSCIVLV